MGAMTGGNDQFALSAVEVAAPIGNDAVAGEWSIAFPSIADDGVIRDGGGDGQRIDGSHEWIVRRERVDAVRNATGFQQRRIKGDEVAHLLADGQK